MKFIPLSSMMAVLVASSAFCDVTVCNVKKVVKNNDGSQTITSCRLNIDSNDQSGSQGSGGISHNLSLGTLTSDCTGYPADYDATGNLVPVRMWDQGAQSPSDTSGLMQEIAALGYLQNGNLGFNASQVSSMHWVAGGMDLLTNLYVAYDSSGKKLGMVLFAGMSPKQSFQGCYIN